MNKRMVQLTLMLSSDNDGEVVNAARAIGRMLKEKGVDWHDLGKYLGRWSGVKEPYDPGLKEEPRPEPKASAARPKSWQQRNARSETDVDVETAQEMTDLLYNAIVRGRAAKMSRKSRDFIEEQQERFNRYGNRTTISVRQYAWISALFEEFPTT